MFSLLFFAFLFAARIEAYDKFLKILPWQYPYSPNLICDIVEHAGMYYASVADAYTFQRSEAVAVWPSPSRTPEACFLFNDHSYLMFFNRLTNQTEMLRNREYRSHRFPANSRFIFDNLMTSLYLYVDNGLHRLDPGKIEALWSSAPPDRIVEEDSKIFKFEGTILDILIIGNQLLYISKDDGLAVDFIKNDRFVRTPNTNNKITKINLLSHEIEYSRSSNLTTFDYIPVSLDLEEPSYKIATLPPFPKRPHSTTGNLSVLLLYIIDICFFLLLIYLIKIKNVLVEKV
jgi:hypothetical protein